MKWQTCWRCRDQPRAGRMAQALAENLNIMGLPKRKRWSQCHKVSSWQGCPIHVCQRKTNTAIIPDREIESQGERKPHFGERERGGSEREHWEEREGSTVKKGRFQGGEGRQAKRTFIGELGKGMIG